MCFSSLIRFQLAYNQTLEIQEAAQRVLDAYVQGLLESVNQIEDAVRKVEEVFQPVEDGLALINDGLDVSSFSFEYKLVYSHSIQSWYTLCVFLICLCTYDRLRFH